MKSIVLLSAGLDSTVNLYKALKETEILLVLTFNYGQRAALREIEKARLLCKELDVKHEVIEVPWFSRFTKTSLLNLDYDVPGIEQVSIDDYEKSCSTATAVWVPNRNGVFLNIGAGYAEGLGADWVIPGFNIEEASTFDDNSTEYLESLNDCFMYSTRSHVKVHCYTHQMYKTEIVALGQELGVNFDLIWPCYLGGTTPCGECESCQRFQRALKENK